MKPSSQKFPPQTRYIIGNEACERFSFYGLRSILAGYMTSQLLLGEDQATSIVHLFIAVNYLLPLVGGWIADKFWGRYKTILYISLFYCLGHAILATADLTSVIETKKWILYAGLALIAVGSGGIKPCVSTFMGDQFKPEQSFLLKKAYAAFYWSINFGSFFAFLIIPWVKNEPHLGWSWAFAIPGIFMGLATFIFWTGRKKYVCVPPSPMKNHVSVWRILYFSLKNRQKGVPFWLPAQKAFPADDVACTQSVMRILKVFILIPPFWALFDQTASTWVLQGAKMQALSFDLLGHAFTVQPEQFQAANPIFVMTLIPFITFVLYPRLSWLSSAPRRMSLGMFMGALAYFAVAAIQYSIDSSATPLSLAWQLLPYMIITVGEILLSTTGLEYAFTQAPARMKSNITSFWNLTIFAGNLLVSLVTWLLHEDGKELSISTERFLFYAVLTLVVSLLFGWVVNKNSKKEPLADA